MQQRFRIQISDLEPIESAFEQEITCEEAEKIVGGNKLDLIDEPDWGDMFPYPPFGSKMKKDKVS